MNDRFWVPLFRCCKVGDERVAVSPPLLFGRGYVFDRSKQTVSVTRAFLRVPLSRVQIAFRYITGLTLTEIEEEHATQYGEMTQIYDVVAISTREPDRRFTVAKEALGWWFSGASIERIALAIYDLTGDETAWARSMRDRLIAAVREAPEISHGELRRQLPNLHPAMGEQVTERLVARRDIRCEGTGHNRRYY